MSKPARILTFIVCFLAGIALAAWSAGERLDCIVYEKGPE